MGNLDYLSDNRIELQGPVNMSTGFPVTEAIDSCQAKLYDEALDCRVAKYVVPLTADADAAATSVFVRDNAPIFVGAIVLIDMDNGQQDRETVTAVDAGTGEVTFSGGSLSAAASEGKKLTVVTYDADTTVLPIDNFQGWEDGMNMEITVDGGAVVEKIVSLVDPDSGYLTLASALGTDTTASNLVKRRLGTTGADNIDMTTAFGTFPTTVAATIPGDETWGFRGVIPHDHPDLQLGMRVRGEITLIDVAPTPDLNMTRKVVGTIINE